MSNRMPNEDEQNLESEILPVYEPLPKQVGLGPVGKGVAAASASALAAAFPASGAVIAGVVAAMHSFGDKLNRQKDERTIELLESASAESALSPEDVVRRLIDNDDLALIAAEAIDAARRSRLKNKAAALGKSLGSILADDALIDLESVWIRIIATVEPAHIRVLEFFLEHTGTMGTGSTLWGTGRMAKVSEVGEQLGLQEAILPLVQDLIGAGLLMDPGAPGMTYEMPDAYGKTFKATPLGAQLFARLSDAGLD
jgi:hypothetical protein